METFCGSTEVAKAVDAPIWEVVALLNDSGKTRSLLLND